MKGLQKLIVNRDAIEADLAKNWAVVSEAIQTILRRENYPDAYNVLKDLTRTHRQLNQQTLAEFIDSLNLPEKIKIEMKKINPFNYTGL